MSSEIWTNYQLDLGCDTPKAVIISDLHDCGIVPFRPD